MSHLSLNAKKIFAAVIVVIVLSGISVSQSPGEFEFRLHRTRYDQIVAKAKALKMDKEIAFLYTTPNMDPATISGKSVNPNNEEGEVEIYRDDDTGTYSIYITTLDRGHAGSFGYVYSDTPDRFPSVNREWTSQRQIDAHWWIGQNDSG